MSTRGGGSGAGAGGGAGASTDKACLLLVVRHGETHWNADRRLQGHCDSSLTALGRGQAVAVASMIANTETDVVRRVLKQPPAPPPTPITAVYSSDLKRAHSTAKPIAEALGLDIQLDPRLRESNLGMFEGHTWDEVMSRWPKEMTAYNAHPEARIPHGESHMDKTRRVQEACLEIARKHAGERVVLVSHGGAISALYELVTGNHPSRPRNTSVSLVSWTPTSSSSSSPGTWKLLAWSSTIHLPDAVPLPMSLPIPEGELEALVGAPLAENEEMLRFFSVKHRTGVQAEASRIMQGLYLCGADWLKENLGRLKDMGITSVLNMAGSEIGGSMVDGALVAYPREAFKDMGIVLSEHDCDDSDKWCAENDVGAVIASAVDFIQAGRDRGGVIVHCSAGQSRSATAVVAYLMQLYKWSAVRALAFVRVKRRHAYPGPGFLAALIEYEAAIGVSPSMPAAAIPVLHLSHASCIWNSTPADAVAAVMEAMGAPMSDTVALARAQAAVDRNGGSGSAAVMELLASSE